MNTSKFVAIAFLATLLPLGAQAAEPEASDIRSEIKREMADARKEVRTEMAKARAELDSEDLSLDKSLHFGKDGKRKTADQGTLPAAKIGIDGGEKAAMAALEATDVSLFSLIVGGMTGSLERRVEATVKQHVVPLVRNICQRLPEVLESQQQLATSLPQFKPYATLERNGIEDCERDVLNDFASR